MGGLSLFSDSKIISLLVSYGIYHRNKVNAFIHLVWVPLLVFSLLGLLHHFEFHWNPLNITKILEINVPFIIIVIENLVFIVIEIPSGVC